MVSIVGVDSRIFQRKSIKPDGAEGLFKSVLGIAVKVRDFTTFEAAYKIALDKAFLNIKRTPNYKYYCVDDFRAIPEKDQILDAFVREIAPAIEKVHVFYTLFSKARLSEVKVYGRKSRKEKIKLSAPTRTYEELIMEHTLHAFPAICSWRLTQFLGVNTVQFHLDSYGGKICEAQEELERGGFRFFVFPSGDCADPVISVADLLLDVLDRRLRIQHKRLLFENIRPVLKEFGEKVLVYPISNKHLPKITPLDSASIDTLSHLKHPVYWVFKVEELIDPDLLKKSLAYRNLIDYTASQNATVKLFDKQKDINYWREGDFGVYLNPRGEQLIDSFTVLGKKFKKFKLEYMQTRSTQTTLG